MLQQPYSQLVRLEAYRRQELLQKAEAYRRGKAIQKKVTIAKRRMLTLIATLLYR